MTFGLLDRSRRDVVERAFQRARDAGANIDLLKNDSAARILAECDAVVALTWPPFESASKGCEWIRKNLRR